MKKLNWLSKSIKKFCIGCLVIIVLPSSGFTQEDRQNPDPRLDYGGMIPQQVYNAENATFDAQILLFRGNVIGYPALIQHYFRVNENQMHLQHTRFTPLTYHEDPQKYTGEALSIAEHYNTYHGQPQKKDEYFFAMGRTESGYLFAL